MIGNAHKTLRRLGLVAALACFAVPAAGAPPPNDDFDNALPVDALPFQDTQDFSEATGASDDPYSTCGLYVAYTAWYSFTPSTDVLVDAYASFVSSVHVYTGSRGNLTQVACGEYQGTVRFQASAGTTYYILVSDAPYSTPPVWVTFSLQEVPPPPPPPVNDEIANATVVPGLPFSETTNVLSATVSNRRPRWCAGCPCALRRRRRDDLLGHGRGGELRALRHWALGGLIRRSPAAILPGRHRRPRHRRPENGPGHADRHRHLQRALLRDRVGQSAAGAGRDGDRGLVLD